MTTPPNGAPRRATIPGPDPNVRRPRVQFPAGACDSHAHVFGPQGRFPYLPHAAYIPPDALPQDYARMLSALGCQRAVLVQPSVYGTDNSCMVAAMTSGVFSFRGVAVVNGNIGDAELEALHRAGVRGLRLTGCATRSVASMAIGPGTPARPSR
jgi:2-pyrone-4,6-dicarboxylate lactonase